MAEENSGKPLTTNARRNIVVADSFLRIVIPGSLTADAVLRKTTSGSFTANVILKKIGTAGSFTGNAVLKKAQSGTFTANAFLKRVQTGSLTADATLKKTIFGSFIANSVLKRNQSSSFTANAFLRIGRTGSLTADATLKKTASGSLSADAVIKKVQSGSFTASAVIMPVFKADAVLIRTQNGSFTANAWILEIGVRTFAANAILFKTIPPRLWRMPFSRRTSTGRLVLTPSSCRSSRPMRSSRRVSRRHLRLARLLRLPIPFSANAIFKKTISGALYGPFTAQLGTPASMPSNIALAFLLPKLTADALLRKTQAGSFTADAVLREFSLAR